MKSVWTLFLRRVARLLQFGRRLRRVRRRLAVRNRLARLVLKPLEDRLVPATITWTNPVGGDWNTAANWDLNRLPTTGDDVVVPDLGGAGADLTVTIASGATTVQSVTSAENLTVTGASLQLAGGTQTVSVAGTALLSNATLKDATLAAGTALVVDNAGPGGILDGVTIAAGATASAGTGAANGTIRLTNGLTVDGTLQIGDDAGTYSSVVTLTNAMTVGGHGTIRFGGSPFDALATSVQGPILFTFGPNLTVRAKGGQITGEGSGASNPTYVIQGPLFVDAGGSGLSVKNDVGTFQTSNAITLAAGAAMTIGPKTWANSAVVSAPTGSSLNLAATTLSNLGTITATDATVYLGGNFTQYALGSANPAPGQGTFNRSGGTVYVTGTVTGGITLDSSTGSWYLLGGTVSGGIVTTDAANTLKSAAFNGPGSFLTNGVTISAGSTVDLTEQSVTITVSGGLTVDGTLLVGNASGGTSSLVKLLGGQTIGGAGSIVFGGSSSNTFTTPTQGAVTFTFGPNLTIHGKSGQFAGEGSGASNPTYVIQGPLFVDAGGSGLSVKNDVGLFQTSNAITLAAGTGLSIAARSWTNSGPMTVSSGTFTVTSASWSNIAPITMSGGTVNFGGSFASSSVANFTRHGRHGQPDRHSHGRFHVDRRDWERGVEGRDHSERDVPESQFQFETHRHQHSQFPRQRHPGQPDRSDYERGRGRCIEWLNHQYEPADWDDFSYGQCLLPLPGRSDGTDGWGRRIRIHAIGRQLFWPGQLRGRSRLCSHHRSGRHRSRSIWESRDDIRSIDQPGHDSRGGHYESDVQCAIRQQQSQ